MRIILQLRFDFDRSSRVHKRLIHYHFTWMHLNYIYPNQSICNYTAIMLYYIDLKMHQRVTGGDKVEETGGAMAWTFGRPIRIYIVLNGVLARSWPWQSYLLADAIICFAFDYS